MYFLGLVVKHNQVDWKIGWVMPKWKNQYLGKPNLVVKSGKYNLKAILWAWESLFRSWETLI